MKKIKYLILIFVLMLVLSGCTQSQVDNIRNAFAEGIKNFFKQTWWLWLIICIVIGFIGVMTSIAKKKAQIKIAKYLRDKIKTKDKKKNKS